MRKAFSRQTRLDCRTVLDVELNLNCRDEIVPILRALQHIYSQPELRNSILDLIAQDVNRDARDDCGREGMDYWQILVLAAVRLGCSLDYDKLQDLAEQHRALRHIMGIGDWDEDTTSVGDAYATTSVCCNRRRSKRSATSLSRQGIAWIPMPSRRCGPIRSSWKPIFTIRRRVR